MGTPNSSDGVGQREVRLDATDRRDIASDPRLAEIDKIVSDLAERDQRSAVEASQSADDLKQFLAAFDAMCKREARPAMEAVLDRLRRDGGGGLIEEHPGGEPRVSTPRLTVWMSLQGEISGSPRSDRHPYLQLDADVKERNVRVSEGDMWGGSGHSGWIASRGIADLGFDQVLLELLAILGRSVPHPSKLAPAVQTEPADTGLP